MILNRRSDDRLEAVYDSTELSSPYWKMRPLIIGKMSGCPRILAFLKLLSVEKIVISMGRSLRLSLMNL